MDPDRHAQRRVSGPGEEVASADGVPGDRTRPWNHDRVSLRTALERGRGAVAGRYQRGRSHDLLADASAVVTVIGATPRPGHGDQIAARLVTAAAGARLSEVEVLTPAERDLSPSLRSLGARRPRLERRAAIVAAIRRHFTTAGFLEVETPSRVVNPGLEPHLVPIAAGHAADGAERWLRTSPELHLKTMLAAGYERLFELAPAFRAAERGPNHATEFTMLEWYRSHAGLDDLARDVAALLTTCAAAAEIEDAVVTAEPERATYAELFRRHAGGAPWDLTVDERDRRFVSDVEPQLGRQRPLLMTEFPPDSAALARLAPPADGRGWPQVAARIELYVNGVELANGFDELTDAAEQRRRHEADRSTRRAAGLATPALDEAFLAALAAAIPPSAGMALGVDRLVMVLTGATSIADVRPFTEADGD